MNRGIRHNSSCISLVGTVQHDDQTKACETITTASGAYTTVGWNPLYLPHLVHDVTHTECHTHTLFMMSRTQNVIHNMVVLMSVVLQLLVSILNKLQMLPGSQDSLLAERQTHGIKTTSLSPGKCDGRFFFSRVNCVCWLLFSFHSLVFVPPMLPLWHIQDTGHSAKSAGGKLNLNMHTPLKSE